MIRRLIARLYGPRLAPSLWRCAWCGVYVAGVSDERAARTHQPHCPGRKPAMTPILCHECGHDIDKHCWKPEWEPISCGAGWCECTQLPSDIARALLTAEPTEAEVEAVVSALSAAGHKWWGCSPVGSIELTVRAALKAAREARA